MHDRDVTDLPTVSYFHPNFFELLVCHRSVRFVLQVLYARAGTFVYSRRPDKGRDRSAIRTEGSGDERPDVYRLLDYPEQLAPRHRRQHGHLVAGRDSKV